MFDYNSTEPYPPAAEVLARTYYNADSSLNRIKEQMVRDINQWTPAAGVPIEVHTNEWPGRLAFLTRTHAWNLTTNMAYTLMELSAETLLSIVNRLQMYHTPRQEQP